MELLDARTWRRQVERVHRSDNEDGGYHGAANALALIEGKAQIMDVVRRHGEVTAEQVREGLSGMLYDSTVRTS